jgi:FixJ family two-component response regulator
MQLAQAPQQVSGPQLARSLCQKKPTLAVIFMSGYTDSSLSAQGVHRDDVNFLQKPFTLEDLCEKLTHAEKMAHKQSAT